MDSFFNALHNYYWWQIQETYNLNDISRPDTWVSSLIHFCNYAFERKGSPSAYRESAIEAFQRDSTWLESRQRWGAIIESRLFDSFRAACNDRYINKYNESRNPMSPSEGNLISLINFAWNIADDKSVAGWALDFIEENNIREAFNSLKRIRGIGNKIASFYLRDIYILSDLHDINLRNKHLLHPIDVWTERAARVLLDNPEATPRQCAQALIDLEQDLGLLTGVSNIGFWVFGSEVTDNISIFIEAVKAISERNSNILRNLLARQIDEEKDWLNFLESLLP